MISMSLQFPISLGPLTLRALKNMSRMREIHQCQGQEHWDGIEDVDEVLMGVDSVRDATAFRTREFNYAEDYSKLRVF